jgi:hypothetical protein
MALPSNLSTITVTGTYIDIAGNPIAGQILFTPRSVVRDPSAKTILINSTIVVNLDTNGQFTTSLVVTDDSDASPTGFTYYVQEAFVGGRSFDMLLPSATVGGTLDLSAVSPAVANDGTGAVYVTVDQYSSLAARITTVENNVNASATFFSGLNTILTAAITASNNSVALLGTYITAVGNIGENGILYPSRAF